MTRKNLIAVFVAAVLAAVSVQLFTPAVAVASCALKSWNQGDTLKSTDLNSNFTCVNNGLKGFGFSLVGTADLSPGAVTRPILSAPTMLPVGWWASTTLCTTNGACSLGAGASQGVTSVTRTAQGAYTVVIPARPDVVYGVMTSGGFCNSTGAQGSCTAGSLTTTGFGIVCQTPVPANVDCIPNFTILDDE